MAGIDRLHLSKPFAVRDLLAAVAFAVQPLDDLNLANLLVSPLIGWSQEQLFDLAYGRETKRAAVAGAARAGRRGAAFRPRRMTRSARCWRWPIITTPARFLETILSGPIDGRRKLYRRLGLAARDPIDELLSSALEFERNETPSLDRFLAWFARGDVEIQRDPVGAGAGGAGDDRARRQGPRGAVRDPRRRDRRPGADRRRRRAASTCRCAGAARCR